MLNPQLTWLDRMFYCIDVTIARLVGRQTRAISLDPSFATGFLTMSFVVAGSEVVELVNAIAGSVLLPSVRGMHPERQFAAIVLWCAAVWLLISFRCVYKGAREAIHRQFDAEPVKLRRNRNAACIVFIAAVYIILPLSLRIVE